LEVLNTVVVKNCTTTKAYHGIRILRTTKKPTLFP